MLERLGLGFRSRFVALGVMLMVAGCGGGGGGDSSPSGTGSNGAAGATPASSPAPASGASEPAASTTPTLAAATPVIDGTTLGDTNWPDGATATGGTGAAVGGLNCGLRSTGYTYAHLSIYQNGKLLSLPTKIGTVDPTMAAPTGCAYPIHTDDASGKIHIDTTTGASYTLGQFFAIWGQTLSASNVAGLTGSPITIYVNDGGSLTQYTGDPSSLVLTPHSEITIMVGTPLTHVPTYTWTDPPPFDPNPISLVYGGTVGTVGYWPDGASATGGNGSAPVDGLTCSPSMSVLFHVHAHLAIVKDGQWLALPANIGIPAPCTYEMHTHDHTGIIHIEAPTEKKYTLGQFFDLWGQPLTSTNVAGITGDVVAYINDNGDSRRYMGDIRNIELTSLRDVTLQIGTPPISTLATYSWYEPQ